jgi:biopolymer transport protein ExbB
MPTSRRTDSTTTSNFEAEYRSPARRRAFARRRSILLVGALLLCVVAFDAAEKLRSQESEPISPGALTTGASEAPAGSTAIEGARAATAVPSVDEHPESYLDFALAGGALMIPIVLGSVIWLTFLVERVIALRRSRAVPKTLAQAIDALDRSRLDGGRLSALLDAHPSSAARVVGVAAERLDAPREEIEAAVDAAAQREIHSWRRYTGLFAVIAAVAPLLGLLGTVTGMIQAFREVAIEGLGSGKALAPGIYKALVTTAAGLIVAIPALITHHWALGRIEAFVHELDDLVVRFVDTFRSRSKDEGAWVRSTDPRSRGGSA